MQADHKQYSYREITKTSSHSCTFTSYYFHSGAMLDFLAMLDHSSGTPRVILRSMQYVLRRVLPLRRFRPALPDAYVLLWRSHGIEHP